VRPVRSEWVCSDREGLRSVSPGSDGERVSVALCVFARGTSFEVSVTDINRNPPLRNDGVPWTTVDIAEAAQLAGPWTIIDTQTLAPVDGDRPGPMARNLSTAHATILTASTSPRFRATLPASHAAL
jgi:hypothetical protein